MLIGSVRSPASGSVNGWIWVGDGVNWPPLTVPTTPLTKAVQMLLGPASTLPLTAIEPPVTSKSALRASTPPRKHSVHLILIVTPASAWLPTRIVLLPVTPPKKVLIVRAG